MCHECCTLRLADLSGPQRLYDANAGLLLSTKSPKNRAYVHIMPKPNGFVQRRARSHAADLRFLALNSVQILSVHWLVRHPYTFFLVTSHGVEMYESNDGGKSCKLTKAASYPNVCHFWYLVSRAVEIARTHHHNLQMFLELTRTVLQASTGTLLVVDMKGVFQSYRLRSAGIHRICKFELDANQSASKWSFAHISLVCLYGLSFQRSCVCFIVLMLAPLSTQIWSSLLRLSQRGERTTASVVVF